jgi:hypothetical protein
MFNSIIKPFLFLLMCSLAAHALADGGSADNARVKDMQVILQCLIDAPQLDKYFHAETIPARKPLRIVKGDWYAHGVQAGKQVQASGSVYRQ